jgi:hypothetical protein
MANDVPAILKRVRAGMTTDSDAKTLRLLLYPSNRQRLEDAAEYLTRRPDVVRAWLPYDVRRKLVDVLIGDDAPGWRCDMGAPNQDIGAPDGEAAWHSH